MTLVFLHQRNSPLHKAYAPSYFTYGSHAAFWMGFTPGVSSSEKIPWLNPKSGKLFRMNHSAASSHGEDAFELTGSNIIEGLLQTKLLHAGNRVLLHGLINNHLLDLYLLLHSMNFGIAERHGTYVLSCPGYLRG